MSATYRTWEAATGQRHSAVNFRPVDVPFLRDEAIQMIKSGGRHTYIDGINSGFQKNQPETGTVEEKVDFLVKREVDRLEQSELFYVSAGMLELAKFACRSIPSFDLTPEDLPSPSGFIVFEEPVYSFRGQIYSVSSGAELGEGEVHGIAASWGPANEGTGSTHICISQYSDRSVTSKSVGIKPPPWRVGLEADYITPIDGSCDPIDEYGNSINAETVTDTSQAYHYTVLKTCWTLMKQTVSSVSDAHLDRATRRRMDRYSIPQSRVRIITLRRASAEHHTGVPSGREFHHRWIVRGHWRNQACGPGRQDHRPVWIAPHIKGPEDGPLLGGEKVHVLSR